MLRARVRGALMCLWRVMRVFERGMFFFVVLYIQHGVYGGVRGVFGVFYIPYTSEYEDLLNIIRASVCAESLLIQVGRMVWWYRRLWYVENVLVPVRY